MPVPLAAGKPVRGVCLVFADRVESTAAQPCPPFRLAQQGRAFRHAADRFPFGRMISLPPPRRGRVRLAFPGSATERRQAQLPTAAILAVGALPVGHAPDPTAHGVPDVRNFLRPMAVAGFYLRAGRRMGPSA